RKSMVGRSNAVFGIATAGGECAHQIADFPACHLRSKLRDPTGHFQSEDGGCAWWRWVIAQSLCNVRTIHTCCMHLDQDLTRTGLGGRHFAYLENIRATARLMVDVFHPNLLESWLAGSLVVQVNTQNLTIPLPQSFSLASRRQRSGIGGRSSVRAPAVRGGRLSVRLAARRIWPAAGTI